MLVALGFLGASLLGLLVASAFWSRAVRLTTARIKQSMPVSEPEMKADRDRLRAEYAIKVHKLETQLDQAKLERARQLIEINRREASISTLETDVVQLKADLPVGSLNLYLTSARPPTLSIPTPVSPP